MSILVEEALNNDNLIYIDTNDDSRTYSLEELIHHNDDVLNGTKKSLAFIYVDNSIESIEAFWSLIYSKHCISLLSDKISDKFKNDLEDRYRPMFIYDNKREKIDGYNLEYLGPLKIMVRKKPIDYLIHESNKVLLSTSGTTGSPKFVKLSEENLLENTRSICNYLPIVKDDTTPLNLPINYSYGLSVLLTNSFNGGEIICSVPDILKREFWNAFEDFEFTSIAGVPFVYEMLNRFSFTDKSYSSLRYLTQAGGKLKDELVLKFGSYAQKNGIKFYVMYGATEASARMSYLDPNKVVEKCGSIGKPIEKGKFYLNSESSELIYEGPNVFGGYANNYNDLSDYNSDNVLNTGDIARKDSEGYFYIEGRIKRFVKISGLRINLDEVEDLIYTLKGITVKCIGKDDKQLILFHDNKDLNIKDFIKEIAKDLKMHHSFIRANYIKEFPLTSNGKVDYKKLEYNL